MSAAKKLHKIVVVGGGAGGLELVTVLGRHLGKKGKARPVLVDRTLTHVWKPLLHEVASGSLNTGEDELNYYSHAFNNGFEFQIGNVNGLDLQNKRVKIAAVKDYDKKILVNERTLRYDTLVMAVGSYSNSFGTPGVKEHCITLDSLWQAEILRRRVLSQALAVIMNQNAGKGPVTELRIGIVGGGPTGVELAAEIYHTTAVMHRFGAHILPGRLQISIMDGGQKLLAASASDALSNYAKKELEKRNIEVRLGAKIKAVTEKGFDLGDGTFLEKDIKIWTAGIKAPDWLKTIGLEVNKGGHIKVNEYLQTSDPSIYAIGDCACAPFPQSGNPERCLPATAQVAHQQAEWLVKKLKANLKNKSCPPFQYNPKGMLVSLGTGAAVGKVAGPSKQHYIEGRGAKAIYSSLYRMHQAALFGVTRTALLMIGDKFRKAAMPSLKLH